MGVVVPGPVAAPLVHEPPARETSGVTTRLILRHVRGRAGQAGVDAVVDRALPGRTAAELEDETSWWTYDEKVRLFEAAADHLDDPLLGVHVGATVLELRVGLALRAILRAAGSPTQVLRNIARTAPKFSAVCTMRASDLTPTSGTVSYRLLAPHRPHRLDCQYNQGLLSQISVLFGLPPAAVQHEVCQVQGAEECVYRLRWARRQRPRWLGGRSRAGNLAEHLAVLTERHDSLQRTVADLVSPVDVDTMLERIATRAAAAVSAPQYLLVTGEGETPTVISSGLSREHARAIAETARRSGWGAVGIPHMVVEVASARRLYGWLAAFTPTGGDFFDEERRLFAAYARHAAAALDVATALEQARHSEDTARALLTLGGRLAGAETVTEVGEMVAETAVVLTGASRASFLLWDDLAFRLRAVAAHGFGAATERMLALEVTPSDTPYMAEMLAGPAVMELDPAVVDPMLAELMATFDTGPVLAVPVLSRAGFLGVVAVGNSGGDPLRITPLLRDRLVGLADQAVTAVEQQRSLERLRHVAATDPLTGLPNRRAFEVVLRDRRLDNFGLQAIDVDNLKVVNDCFGHEAGDNLLRTVSEVLRATLRADDAVYRIGGDEFAVVMPTATEEEVRTASERVRGAVRAVVLPWGPARVTIGCTSQEPGVTVQEAWQVADEALYRAKRGGRDRVEWARRRAVGGDPVERRWDTRLVDLLQKRDLDTVFQPVVDLATGAWVGVEALARPAGIPALGSVEDLFRTAHRLGLHRDLDWLARRVALDCGRALPGGLPLYLNVGAGFLVDPAHDVDQMLLLLRWAGRDPKEVILEITERETVPDLDRLVAALAVYRAEGFRFALDDLGEGHSAFGLLARAVPEVVKLSRALVHRRGERGGTAAIRALVTFAQATGSLTVAEGVEDGADAHDLLALGVTHAQGFGLAVPAAATAIALAMTEPGQPLAESTAGSGR